MKDKTAVSFIIFLEINCWNFLHSKQQEAIIHDQAGTSK